MSHEDRTLCECIIFSIADLFAHASHFEIVQAGNGIDAIAVGLVLLSNEDNIKAINDENPLCLLLKLALNDWSYQQPYRERNRVNHLGAQPECCMAFPVSVFTPRRFL
ncbi:MAG: hypothetical protein ACLTR6_14160 [Clostridium fessum]